MNVFGQRLVASTSKKALGKSWRHRKPSSAFSRSVHNPRGLPYKVEEGLGDFLPPAALKTVAVDYQNGLLERLNDEVRGTNEEHSSVVQTIINTSTDRSRTLAFNYASEALNNSFFLDMLTPPPPPPAVNYEGKITQHLLAAIRSNHGSLDQLKSSFSGAVTGMRTSGWLWLVADKNGQTAILPTFGSGTLLVRSRMHLGEEGVVLGEQVGPKPTTKVKGSSLFSPPPPTSPASGIDHGHSSPNPPTPIRSIHGTSSRAYDPIIDAAPASILDELANRDLSRSFLGNRNSLLNHGEALLPLFCVSIHEHAWLSAGYGVWGKEEWVKKFWTVLNWEKVSKSFGRWASDNNSFI